MSVYLGFLLWFYFERCVGWEKLWWFKEWVISVIIFILVVLYFFFIGVFLVFNILVVIVIRFVLNCFGVSLDVFFWLLWLNWMVIMGCELFMLFLIECRVVFYRFFVLNEVVVVLFLVRLMLFVGFFVVVKKLLF